MKRTTLRPRSARHAKIDAARKVLNAELRNQPRRCEFPLGCTQTADCWHEYHTRGQGGSIVDRENLRAACIFHNGWAEDNPLEAHRIGWRLLRKAA